MIKKGNGSPIICAQNLLKTYRGEVPYSRMKGLPSSIIDLTSTSKDEIETVAQKVVKMYEPRAPIVSVNMSEITADGDFSLGVNIN